MKQETAKDPKGDFQKALDLAIGNAAKHAPGPDVLMKWKLEEVSGEHGGIAGKGEVSVTISYKF